MFGTGGCLMHVLGATMYQVWSIAACRSSVNMKTIAESLTPRQGSSDVAFFPIQKPEEHGGFRGHWPV